DHAARWLPVDRAGRGRDRRARTDPDRGPQLRRPRATAADGARAYRGGAEDADPPVERTDGARRTEPSTRTCSFAPSSGAGDMRSACPPSAAALPVSPPAVRRAPSAARRLPRPQIYRCRFVRPERRELKPLQRITAHDVLELADHLEHHAI